MKVSILSLVLLIATTASCALNEWNDVWLGSQAYPSGKDTLFLVGLDQVSQSTFYTTHHPDVTKRTREVYLLKYDAKNMTVKKVDQYSPNLLANNGSVRNFEQFAWVNVNQEKLEIKKRPANCYSVQNAPNFEYCRNENVISIVESRDALNPSYTIDLTNYAFSDINFKSYDLLDIFPAKQQGVFWLALASNTNNANAEAAGSMVLYKIHASETQPRILTRAILPNAFAKSGEHPTILSHKQNNDALEILMQTEGIEQKFKILSLTESPDEKATLTTSASIYFNSKPYRRYLAADFSAESGEIIFLGLLVDGRDDSIKNLVFGVSIVNSSRQSDMLRGILDI